MKAVDFSETIAFSDLKIGRSRHLFESQGHILTLPKVVYIQKIKLDSLRNYYADLNQILYEGFRVQGNENLIT